MDEKERLQELFKKFPGIGPRQAERFVYFLLHSSPAFKESLLEAIKDLNKKSRKCDLCDAYFLSKNENEKLCRFCADKARDKTKLLVLEKETEIAKMESSGFDGLYFVTLGTISPLHDSNRHRFFFQKVLSRIRKTNVKELTLAFSATFEGEYSANFLKDELKKINDLDIKIYTLGRGLSSGSEIEYADPETLKEALKNRKQIS